MSYSYEQSGTGDLHIVYLTCLAIAIEKKNLEIVKLLIETKKFDIKRVTYNEYDIDEYVNIIHSIAEFRDDEGDENYFDYLEYCKKHGTDEISEYLEKIEKKNINK